MGWVSLNHNGWMLSHTHTHNHWLNVFVCSEYLTEDHTRKDMHCHRWMVAFFRAMVMASLSGKCCPYISSLISLILMDELAKAVKHGLSLILLSWQLKHYPLHACVYIYLFSVNVQQVMRNVNERKFFWREKFIDIYQLPPHFITYCHSAVTWTEIEKKMVT